MNQINAQCLREFTRGYVGWKLEDGSKKSKALFEEAVFRFNKKYGTEFSIEDLGDLKSVC